MKNRFAFLQMIFACALSSAAIAQPDTITVLHLNDTHGCIAPGGPRTAELKATRGGIARAATIIGLTKMTEPNVLTLHAGDFSVGDIMYNMYFGVPELEILAGLGLDAMTIGNHEFDLTPATLEQVLDTASAAGVAFPLLSANCNLQDTAVAGLRKYILNNTKKKFGNTTVGIFGLTTPSTNLLSQPSPAFIDTNLVGIAQAEIDSLRASGCTVVILLSHLGYTLDSVVASYTHGIDLIVGGHDHDVFQSARSVLDALAKAVPIVQAGAHYSYIGKVRLVHDQNGVRMIAQEVITLDETVPEEPQTAALIDTLAKGVEATFGPMYSVRIADATADFEEYADHLRADGPHDTPVGNLCTDAFRDATGADVAIEVGGSTAEKLYGGPVVGADIFRMIGYGYNTDNGLGYRLATFRMSGAALATGLEFGLSDIQEDDEFFVQVSGMRYQYSGSAQPFERLGNVSIGDAPLDSSRMYTVAANEFAALFLTQIGLPISDLHIFHDTTEFQVVASYLQKKKVVSPVEDGRIVSGTLSVKTGAGGIDNTPLAVYPQPCNTQASLRFFAAAGEHFAIDIVDEVGRKVMQSGLRSTDAGLADLPISTTSLPNGIYTVILRNGTRSASASLVVIH